MNAEQCRKMSQAAKDNAKDNDRRVHALLDMAERNIKHTVERGGYACSFPIDHFEIDITGTPISIHVKEILIKRGFDVRLSNHNSRMAIYWPTD
jgi:hypothetical protein